jgi:hypothetical protein
MTDRLCQSRLTEIVNLTRIVTSNPSAACRIKTH